MFSTLSTISLCLESSPQRNKWKPFRIAIDSAEKRRSHMTMSVPDAPTNELPPFVRNSQSFLFLPPTFLDERLPERPKAEGSSFRGHDSQSSRYCPLRGGLQDSGRGPGEGRVQGGS